MAKLPRFYTIPLFIALFLFVLSGCALQRDETPTETQSAAEGMPPTLAPLGSDTTDLSGEAPVAPTTINVQPTGTNSTLGTGAASEDDGEQTLPTSQPVDLSSEATETGTLEQTAAVEPESFVPPTAEEASTTSPIIVSVSTEEELPSGGPIATNPPVSETSGDYTVEAAPIAPTFDPETGYTVQAGDTLFGLSLTYDSTVQEIMLANGLNSETIYEGQTIIIPGYSGVAAPVVSQDGLHTVSTGETLFSIAVAYGTTVDALATGNNLAFPYIIYPGQVLYIVGDPGSTIDPGSGVGLHTVAPGETLYFIAQRYGVTTQALVAANGLSNPNQIQSGEILVIPQ